MVDPYQTKDANADVGDLSRADRALLGRLRHAIKQGAEFAITPEQFACRLLGIAPQEWMRLQERVPKFTVTYADLCCVLAFLDIDYAANVARIRAGIAYNADSGLEETGDCCDTPPLQPQDFPAYLGLLFRRHRDGALLTALLDMELALPAVVSACTSVVAFLWDDDSDVLLRCTAMSSLRSNSLAMMLAEVCRRIGDARVKEIYVHRLRQAQRCSDPLLADAASRILYALDLELP